MDMAASSSSTPMEQVEPISQVSEALRIIEEVTKTSSKFLMNKRQCESLRHRLVYAIGETLKEFPREQFACSQSLDVAGNKMDYPAFDLLLTVLKKAQALLAKYTEPKETIPSVLTRTEDREAFQEIHAELDLLKSQFLFNDGSASQRVAMLTGDADEDRHNLSDSLHEAAVLPTNLEKMKLVVSEKSSEVTSSDGLPSYLAIDPTSVEIKGEVRVPGRLSKKKKNSGYKKKKNSGSGVNEVSLHARPHHNVHRTLGVDVWFGNRTWNTSELLQEARSPIELHELMERRSGNRPFSRAEEVDIITQIAKCMLYLHEKQISQ